MSSSIRPLAIVAILALIGLGLWLRNRESEHRQVLNPPGVAKSPVLTPRKLPVEGRPAQMETPADRRRKAEIERNTKRDDLRTRLVKLMTEAEQLSLKAESLALAGQPLTTEIRLTAVQKEVEGIAQDRTFPDIREAATHGVEAIKSRRAPKISVATHAATLLPAQ